MRSRGNVVCACVALATLLALFGACSSAYTVTGVGPLDGAADASSVDGASGPGADSSGLGAGDATAQGDAGSDGGVATFCDSVDAAFCWSFDREPYATGSQLLLVNVGDAGTIAVTTAALSSPNALRVDLAQQNEKTGVLLPVSAARVICSASFKVDALTATAFTAMEVTGSGAGATLVVTPSATADRASVSVTSSLGASVGLGDVPLGGWQTISIDVNANTGTLSASMNGGRGTVSGLTGLVSGIFFGGESNPNGGATISFDNLSCQY